MLIGDGTHNGANSQAVEIVVNEDQAAQQNRCQLCAYAGLDIGFCPATEGRGCACLVQQGDHCTQQYQEHQNTDVVGVSQNRNDAAVEYMQHSFFQIEVCVQQTTNHDTDEQRGIYFLGDQCQCNGNDGRQQCPCGVIKTADSFCIAGCQYRSSECRCDQNKNRQQCKNLACVVSHSESLFSTGDSPL